MALQLQFYDPDKAICVQPTFYEAYQALKEWDKFPSLVIYLRKPKEKPAEKPVSEGLHEGIDTPKPHKAKAKSHK